MKKYYQVVYTVVKVVEIDDDEMREFDWGPEITDEMRLEYLEAELEAKDIFDNCEVYDRKITETNPWG